MFVTNLRQSGIDTLGDVPWGTHFCHFYKTREDLLSILVPYFKAGLANNEFCMWVTAEFLSAQEATQAMIEAVPDFASYVSRGQMEIVPHNQWYRKNGAPSLQKALDGWIEKLNEALARGYEGMRVSGDTIWLRKKDWKKFTDYEETVNGVMGNHRMIALCTYSLERCNTDAVFDVMGNHGVALIRNEGEWEVIETSASTKTREALREREERLRAVFNASTAMILLLDRHGTVLEANEAQGQVMGLEREAVVGKNIWDLFGPDIAQGRRAQVEKVLQTGEPLRVEDEGQNGRWYGASIYPVRDAQGVITGVAVYSRDITETKRADDTVRGREELYRHLLGSTTDGIFALDGGWRYVLFNEAYTRIVGLPKETLTGARITDLFPGIEETQFFEAFERVIKMGVSETVNGEFTFPDGRTGWYDVSVDPVPEGILCIARDITEQKRVLDSLSASEEKHRLLVENAH
jgi:PAS domain S-box-containing protein